MKPPCSTLTGTESERFADLRRRAKATAIDLGKILAEIKESKLYVPEFRTWENFCNAEYGFSPQHSLRLIAASELKSEPMGSLLDNERQYRELAKVSEADRAQVLEMATSGGHVTASAIESAHATLMAQNCTAIESQSSGRVTVDKASNGLEKHSDAVEVDCEGFPLAAVTLDRWHRRDELQSLMKEVSRIKARVKEAFEAKEWLGNNINFQSLTADLSNAYSTLKFCTPYAVCTSCNAVRPEKCTFCRGTGLLSEFTWRTAAPLEAKELRARSLK